MKEPRLTRRTSLLIALTSMEWTIRKFETYEYYPSEQFRKERIAEIRDAMGILRKLHDQL